MKCEKFSFYMSQLFVKSNQEKTRICLDAREHIDTVVSISLFSIVLKMCAGNWKKKREKKKYKRPLETWHVLTVLTWWKPKEPDCSFCPLTYLCLLSAMLMFALFKLPLLLFMSAYIVLAAIFNEPSPLLFPTCRFFVGCGLDSDLWWKYLSPESHKGSAAALPSNNSGSWLSPDQTAGVQASPPSLPP